MTKKFITVVGVAGLLALTASACSVEEPTDSASADTTEVQKDVKASADHKAKPKPKLTVAQKNAKQSAESYLDMAGFSKKGLIKQLKFEKYKPSVANWAANHVEVSWMKEAAESAEAYMDTSSFSRQSLIQQLEFEGFTPAQAAHGAKAVGY